MSVEDDLRKEGITVIKPLDTLTINTIAKKVSNKLCAKFSEQNLDANELFITISRLNMYIAKMPNDNSVAKYYYKNSSIYFDENIDFDNIDKYAIHECIHVIQSKKDIKNNVIQLGLCDFSSSKLPGMALNEAAVQLMTEKCLESEKDTVKYFGIDLSTTSPDYYPLECALASQMAYVAGENVLFYSTLFGNTIFKDTFTSLTTKNAYTKIEKNIDKIMTLEDKLGALNVQLENTKLTNKSLFKTAQKITDTKQNIASLFLQTQNLIMTSYFDTYYQTLKTSRDIENFRNKLYNFKNYIGVTDEYTFYNEYYLKMMTLLEEKYEQLNNYSTSLTVYKPSVFNLFFSKLKKLVGLKTETENQGN